MLSRFGEEALVDFLASLGFAKRFGTSACDRSVCEAVHKDPSNLLHFRHEPCAAFAAIRASLATTA